MKNRQLGLKFTRLIFLLLLTPLILNAQQRITIERALEIAEESNPQMMTQKLRLERSQLLLDAQRASLKSQFSLTMNPLSYSRSRSFDNRLSQWYTNERLNSQGTFRVVQPILFTDGEISLVNTFGWQDNKSTATGLDNRNRAFTNDLYIRLSQPLFTYKRRQMELKQLEFDYENAGITYAIQRLTTEQNITRQFYNVYMAQENLAISRSELESSQMNYDIIKGKVDADMLAQAELYQAEINLTTAQSSVEQGIVTLENAKDQLKQTLGIPLSEEIIIDAEIIVDPVSIDVEEAISYGLSSRLEIRQREIAISQQELQMITVKAQNEFSGNVNMSVGIIGDDERFGNMYQNPTSNPSIQISFNIPIFDWGAKRARVRAQQTQQTITKLDYDNQKIDIELDIRQAWRALENYRAQIVIAEKRVVTAQLTYDINNVRYRNGEITGLQNSQYQTQLSSNKSAHLQSQINYKIQLLNMKILSLYDFDKKIPLVPVRELPKD